MYSKFTIRNLIIIQRWKWLVYTNLACNLLAQDSACPKVFKSLHRCVSRCWRFFVQFVIGVSHRKVRKCEYSLEAIEPKQFVNLRKPLRDVDTLLQTAFATFFHFLHFARKDRRRFNSICPVYKSISTEERRYGHFSARNKNIKIFIASMIVDKIKDFYHAITRNLSYNNTFKLSTSLTDTNERLSNLTSTRKEVSQK